MSKKTHAMDIMTGRCTIIMEDGRVQITVPNGYNSLVEMFLDTAVRDFERPKDFIEYLQEKGIDIGAISGSCRQEIVGINLEQVLDLGNLRPDLMEENYFPTDKEKFFNDQYLYLCKKMTGKISKSVLKVLWKRAKDSLDISRERFIDVHKKNLRAILDRTYTFDDPEVLEENLFELYTNGLWEEYDDFAKQELKKGINAEFDRIQKGI